MNNFAKQTILKKGEGLFGSTRTLVHSTAGLEIAGSGTRETKEKYGSLWINTKHNTNGGKWFKTYTEALNDFKEYTRVFVNQD